MRSFENGQDRKAIPQKELRGETEPYVCLRERILECIDIVLCTYTGNKEGVFVWLNVMYENI